MHPSSRPLTRFGRVLARAGNPRIHEYRSDDRDTDVMLDCFGMMHTEQARRRPRAGRRDDRHVGASPDGRSPYQNRVVAGPVMWVAVRLLSPTRL